MLLNGTPLRGARLEQLEDLAARSSIENARLRTTPPSKGPLTEISDHDPPSAGNISPDDTHEQEPLHWLTKVGSGGT